MWYRKEGSNTRPIHLLEYLLFYSWPSSWSISTPYNPLRILPLQAKISQYSISPAHGQSEYHLYYPCWVSSPSLLPMSTPFTSSPGHVQSVLHLSLSILSKFSLFITPTAHIQSEYHLLCSSPISTISPVPILLEYLLPKFSKYTIISAQRQSEYHLSNSCPLSTSSLLPMSCED